MPTDRRAHAGRAMSDRVLLVRLDAILRAVNFGRPGVAELLDDLIRDVERTGHARLARIAVDPTRPIRLARGTEKGP